MADLFFLPFRPAYDGNMKAIPGAKMWFTLEGTNVASAPYEDESLTTPHTNPVVANGLGRFPTIWLDNDISYRVRIYDADAVVGTDTPIEEYDPWSGDIVTEGTFELEGVTTPETYGAIGDGETDDYAAIQEAIDTGKRVVFNPQTTYAIGSTLVVGDGSSSSVSSLNGVCLEGTTVGAAESEFAPAVLPTCLKWIGAADGVMMLVQGPMVGCNINGLTFDCNDLALTGVWTRHMVGSTWRDVVVTRYIGTAFIHEAYGAFSGMAQGANKNTFINCRAKDVGAEGCGIRIGNTDGFVAGKLDVAQNVWINCEWYYDGAYAFGFGVWLGFCDNLTFIECQVWPQGGSSGVSIYACPPSGGAGNTAFPSEILFLNCPSLGGVTSDASWEPPAGITCYPYPTADGQPVPTTEFICGADFNHRFFGTWALALKAAAEPVNNGDMVVQKSSDTSLTFKVRGGDGVVRSGSLALS